MQFNQYNKFLQNLISEHNFFLSVELGEALMKEFKTVSPQYSRKIIQRAVDAGVFQSSKPLTFKNGQFLYFNQDFTLDKNLIKSVSQIQRPPMYRLLDLMDINDGIISYYEALKITASSDEKTSTKISLTKDIVNHLVIRKIIREVSDNRNIKYLVYKDEEDKYDSVLPDQKIFDHYQSMVMDTVMIPDILRWLQSCNIIDNIKVIYRSSKFLSLGALKNGVVWDAFGYTKTTGINELKAVEAFETQKQTLVVLDVVLSREYQQIDFDAFLSRIQIHINSTKDAVRKVIPIVFYNSVGEKTLNILKKNGFMVFAISSVFGGNISKILESLKKTQIQELADTDFEGIKETLELIEQNGLDETLKSLRGALFEAILYPLLKYKYNNSKITQGKIIRDKKDSSLSREFDYYIESSQPNEIILVELKGYPKSSSIPLGEWDKRGSVKYFFKGSVPLVQRNIKSSETHASVIKTVFITSGGFYEDGYEFLEKMNKSKFKSQNMDCYYDGDSLLKLLNDNNFIHEAKTIKKYFSEKTDSNIDSKTKKAL